MNIRRRLTSGDMLLLELIFAIVFFCLAMAASMSVFGNAYEMSSKAAARDMAVREAASAAEIVRSAESFKEAGELLVRAGYTFSGSGYEKTFGDEGNTISVNLKEAGKLITADIRCYDLSGTEEDAIYSLTVDHCTG